MATFVLLSINNNKNNFNNALEEIYLARFGKRIGRFIFNNPLNNDYNDDSANYSDVDGNNNKKKMV